MTHVGDLLLTWHAATGLPPSRAPVAAWPPGESVGGALLQIQPARPGWKGCPFLELSTARGWRAWLLGELYGPEEPALQVEGILAQPERASELNGHFLLLAWAEQSQRWYVWTSRFGTFHAYHAASGRRAALGTYFPAVAAAASARKLDWEALTAFFGCGFFLGDCTFYADTRVLRPASLTVLDAGGRILSTTRTWEWWHRPDTRRSYSETLHEYDRRLRTVVNDLVARDRVALPISGGLDSRSAVAALPPDSSPWAYSYGYQDGGPEQRIAAGVAAAKGLSLRAFTVGQYLFDSLEPLLDTLEGFQDVTQARQWSTSAPLAENADFVIGAHLGDLWHDAGLPFSSAGLDPRTVPEHASHKLRKPDGAWLLHTVCQPQLGAGANPDRMVDEAIAARLSTVQIEDPGMRIKALKVEQWVFRLTHTGLRSYLPAAYPRLPFYDNRLADFFLTVPSAFLSGRRAQIDHLIRFAPDLARIPWQFTGAPLNLPARWALPLLLPRRGLAKLWRRLSGRRVLERNWEVQLAGERGRRGLERWLLAPGLRVHEFVSREKLLGLVDRFSLRPLESAYSICMLLTFSAWLERHG